jgi:hypothetical protein
LGDYEGTMKYCNEALEINPRRRPHHPLQHWILRGKIDSTISLVLRCLSLQVFVGIYFPFPHASI